MYIDDLQFETAKVDMRCVREIKKEYSQRKKRSGKNKNSIVVGMLLVTMIYVCRGSDDPGNTYSGAGPPPFTSVVSSMFLEHDATSLKAAYLAQHKNITFFYQRLHRPNKCIFRNFSDIPVVITHQKLRRSP